jgi:hypothetical protein
MTSSSSPAVERALDTMLLVYSLRKTARSLLADALPAGSRLNEHGGALTDLDDEATACIITFHRNG